MQTGVVRARQSVLRFMTSTCVITRGMTTIYSGKCTYKSAEANQGQAAHEDAVEANAKALHTYDIWIPWGSPEIMESDFAVLDGTVTLTIIALEAEATHKTAIQLRGAKHRLTTLPFATTFIRISATDGTETSHGPYTGQLILESATPTGQGEVISGGVQYYLTGSVMLSDLTANVLAGDRFKYDNRFGEVLGLPAISNDRLQLKVRLPGGGYG